MVEESLPARVRRHSEDRNFEQLTLVNQHGAEYWSARDLQPLLGYSQWRSFEKGLVQKWAFLGNSGWGLGAASEGGGSGR